MNPRVLAIGDIHGCYRALRALLDFVAPRDDDFLVMLGDYVDRGLNSFAVVDWLLHAKKTRRIIPLRGNHEIMMFQARENKECLDQWLDCGGRQTLASYSHFGNEGRLADVPNEHWEFLENELLGWFETDTHFFVHANAYPDYPLDSQPDFMLYWESLREEPRPHESGKIMVCGHTPQRSGVPLHLGHIVCIDTWACGDGWLTCLDTSTNRYWQANEDGETRTDYLD